MADRNGSYTIGDWCFVAAEDELRRGDERRKLEHRAARTLELLCRHRGEAVSREAILDAVWQGRAVSPNSIAIVVSDLREALGDSARDPAHIETVAKRGYRLRAANGSEAAPAARKPDRRLLGAAAVAAIIGLALLAWWIGTPPPKVQIAVAPVADQTGDPRYAPLAKASDAVLLDAARRETGVSVGRGGPGTVARVRLESRLILWSGKPTLMMSATDENDKLIWSGMSHGGEDSIPRDVTLAMRDLGKRLAR